jgi:hypothetical protein
MEFTPPVSSPGPEHRDVAGVRDPRFLHRPPRRQPQVPPRKLRLHRHEPRLVLDRLASHFRCVDAIHHSSILKSWEQKKMVRYKRKSFVPRSAVGGADFVAPRLRRILPPAGRRHRRLSPRPPSRHQDRNRLLQNLLCFLSASLYDRRGSHLFFVVRKEVKK